MPLRTYLHLLRPVSAALWLTLGIALLSFILLFPRSHPPATFLFLVLTTASPFFAGMWLAGVAHEPQHRPFALLLPGLHRTLFRRTLATLLGLAVLLTGLAWLARPDVPTMAVFGLVAVQLALPCANRRAFGWGGAGYVWAFVAFLAWIVLVGRLNPRLADILKAAPWTFLFLGLATAAAALWYGFAPTSRRARAGSPYSPILGSVYPLYTQQSAIGRYAEETRQLNAGRQKNNKASNRKWPLKTVSSRISDWVRVIDWQRHFSLPRLIATQFVISAFTILFLVGMPLLLPKHGAAPGGSLLTALSRMLSPIQANMDQFPAMILTLTLFSGFTNGFLSRPASFYPASRKRLSQAVFAHALLMQASAFTILLTCIASFSFLGQASTGSWQPWCGIPALALIAILAVALVPWVLALSYLAKSRHSALLFSFFPAVVGPVGIIIIRGKAWSVPHTILIHTAALLLFALGLWLMWLSIRRHYRTCDLVAETAFANPLGIRR